MREVEIAVAVNPDGAAGIVGAGADVVALAVFEYGEFPAALNATTLKKYCVEAVSEPAEYDVVFAPTVAISLKFVPSVELSILKPDSSAEPSAHARLIALLLAVVAVKPVGGLGGGVGDVVAFAIFEYGEFPAALNATTLKKYCVEAVSEPAEYDVVFAPTVAISLKFVPSVDLSILKPDSSAEPSVHARLIELLLAAAAVRPLGALGGAGGSGLPFIIVK